MNFVTIGTIMTIDDSRGRPLVILRRSPKGKMLYIVMRYKDMNENDKDVVRTAYKIASDRSAEGADTESNTGSIEDFLSFSENRLCG